MVALLVAAVAYAGAAALSLGDPEEPEGAPVPQRSQQTRQAEPSSPAATLPTSTPSPRVAGSDPLPAEPTQQEEPAPAPPAPTPPPETSAPPEPSETPDPQFSFPSGWPTPSGCARTPWC